MTVDVPKELYERTALIVVNTPERGVTFKLVFEKAGIKVVTAYNIYEAVRLLDQHMPHMVISESLLSDGHAGLLYDRMKQMPLFKAVPVFVAISKKDKKEIEPLVGRKFAGFFIGNVAEGNIAENIKEAAMKTVLYTPYYIDIENTTFKKEQILSCSAAVIGKSNDFVVTRSDAMIDYNASVICSQQAASLAPALMTHANNLRDQKGNYFYNMFPLGKIQGKGLQWLSKMPEFNMAAEGERSNRAASGVPRRVLFFDPEKARFEAFSKILAGYDIELVYAPSLNVASEYVLNNLDRISTVYLHELLTDATAIKWTKVYSSLKPEQKPPLIIGTSAVNKQSGNNVFYIRRPFGLGQFIEVLEASFERTKHLDQMVDQRKGTANEIQVVLQAPAKLIMLDEIGGVLNIGFPLKSDTKLVLNNDLLKELWGQNTIKIVSCAFHQTTSKWYVRFQGIDSSRSRARYFEKLEQTLKAKGLMKSDTAA